MMKVIFLADVFCGGAFLNRLCEHSGGLIIVVSTWRASPAEQWERLLAQGLDEQYLHADWQARQLHMSGTAATAIRVWLKRQTVVSAYVVIASDRVEDHEFRWVCVGREGLNDSAYDFALELLR